MSAVFWLLAASVAPPAVTVSPPPGTIDRRFVVWSPGEVLCDGERIDAVHLESPSGFSVRRFNRSFNSAKIRFDIDGRGRAISAGFDTPGAVSGGSVDILPSLAASQFTKDSPKTGCSISYTPTVTLRDEADPEQLARHGLYSLRGRIPKRIWKRISPGDCTESRRPAPLIRHYPNRRDMEQHEGRSKWSYVGYDLDADGVPTNIRIIAKSGDDLLDSRSLEAIAASRFDSGNRTGCANYFAKGPAILESPPKPEKGSFDSGPEACSADDRWEKKPVLKFPEPYRRRAIEGWALMRYDVAPWGQIGNIKVLQSEPTDHFGSSAKRLLRSAKFKPLDQGLSGCTERVIYRINRKQHEGDGETPETDD